MIAVVHRIKLHLEKLRSRLRNFELFCFVSSVEWDLLCIYHLLDILVSRAFPTPQLRLTALSPAELLRNISKFEIQSRWRWQLWRGIWCLHTNFLRAYRRHSWSNVTSYRSSHLMTLGDLLSCSWNTSRTSCLSTPNVFCLFYCIDHLWDCKLDRSTAICWSNRCRSSGWLMQWCRSSALMTLWEIVHLWSSHHELSCHWDSQRGIRTFLFCSQIRRSSGKLRWAQNQPKSITATRWWLIPDFSSFWNLKINFIASMETS